ncbi:tRNA lysidine(34) synthetase TilS [Halomonas sp. HL-93]|uniref:tRNA lysidine(34) synthetase TilS n=1 Tax=Halomonas sp. HL-93 TaxID=1666906 RepID=UPI0006D99E5B|nr:tRNA lysidine(34) synthetase TilS [Halomonas sp. HL-93]KPQ22529.1 MAG: tRNA(Ile)-lysidine synthase TilS [Halomonas sp. HL-93]SBR51334.1 tRNA(Ile)-lysidine synthase [Halomonas sp. HL-93]
MARQLPKSLVGLLNDALVETPPGRSIWVALSGGLDSSLLLAIAVDVCRKAQRPLRALHVNHALQPAADAFEAHCLALCASFDVPLTLARLKVERQGEGLEGAARRARLAAFQQHIPLGDTLWLAQHQNDQAETLLLAAMRGSGVRGLAAMPYRREWQGITLLRPWLDVSRQQIAETARAMQLAWCEDPTNRDVTLDRNLLRHQVMPLLEARWPAASRALSQSARLAGEADQLLAAYAAEELQTLHGRDGSLDVAALRLRERPRQRLLVRSHCQQSDLPTPPRKRLESLLDQLAAAADAQVRVTWPGAEARVWRGRLYIMPPLERLAPWQTQWDGQPGIETPLGPLRLSLKTAQPVTLRWRRGGEVIRLAERGRREIKRLLQETQLPPWQRDRLILVMHEEECLGVVQLPATLLWRAQDATFV